MRSEKAEDSIYFCIQYGGLEKSLDRLCLGGGLIADGGSGLRLNDGLFVKTLTSVLGLDDMSLAWSAVVQLLVFIYSGTQQNCHEYSSLFIIVINLLFFLFSR